MTNAATETPARSITVYVGRREDCGCEITAEEWDTYCSLVSERVANDYPGSALAERVLACADARPVDVAVTPERWRWRSRLLGLDVSLVVQRVDAEGTPLVVSAMGRSGPARSARRGAGR